MKYPYLLSDKSLTVIINNEPYQTDRSNPHWDQIKTALNNENTTDDELVGLLKPINAIASAFENHESVRVHDGNLIYQGHVISSALATRILDILAEGLDVEPWVRFANNVYSNPNDWSREELYLFLERCNLPITADGCFIAYKKVRDDYRDVYSGSIDNSVGQLVVMPGGRQKVNPDRERTCSYGLHFCSKEYLNNFSVGLGGARTLLVKINPADVVSIPNDYDNTKGRCWRYEVVGEIPQHEAQSIQWSATESGYGDYQWGPEDDEGWLDDPDDEEDVIDTLFGLNIKIAPQSYESWLDSDDINAPVPVDIEDDSTPGVKIETVGNGTIDAKKFKSLLATHGTLAKVANACGVSQGTVQSWKVKLFPKSNTRLIDGWPFG